MKTTFEVEPRTPLLGPGPFTIDAPGSYFLTQDARATDVNVVTIAAADVTLDLAGFTIAGNGNGMGVDIVAPASRVLVHGGRIVGTTYGVRIEGAPLLDIVLRDLDVSSTTSTGIHFTNATGIVERCTVHSPAGSGIVMSGSGARGVVVTDCVVRGGSPWAIVVFNEAHVDVRRCLVTNAANGIVFWNSDGALPPSTGSITDCLVFGCADAGIRLLGSAGPHPGVVAGRNLSSGNGVNFDLNGSPLAVPQQSFGTFPDGWANAF